MSQTVREFLAGICAREGYGTEEGSLTELLTEGARVHSGDTDEHRWYICQDVVNEVEGTFIRFTDFIITGDNSMSDMDLSYDLDAAKIVTKKERRITETYYE